METETGPRGYKRYDNPDIWNRKEMLIFACHEYNIAGY